MKLPEIKVTNIIFFAIIIYDNLSCKKYTENVSGAKLFPNESKVTRI